MNKLQTIIVSAALVDKAKGIGKAIGPAYDRMYTTPCSPTGNLPATHYISSGLLSIEAATILPDAVALHNTAVTNAAKQNIPFAITQPETTDIVAKTDLSEEPPFVALARLGLKLIHTNVA